ncbi:MAG: AEC family transporter [Rhodospirillales bacterium]
MTGILSALAPVFGLIVLGYLLKARRVFTDAFWDPAERMTFYVLFPALLFTNIGTAPVGGLRVLPMAASLVAATLAAAGLAMALRPGLARRGLSGAGFVSVFQGAIRPNTYVGIAAAYALFGDAGLTLAAVAIVAVIPLVNFLGIVAHLRWAHPPQPEPVPGRGAALVTAVKNPIIVACVLGALLNLSGLGLPPVVGPMLEIMGRAALPLGLMAVGAGLDLAALRDDRAALFGSATLKLAATPALTLLACKAFGVAGATAAVAVLFMALPVSAASYVMSRQLGGDSRLMAGIVTATTIGAGATLPLWVLAAG